MNAPVVRVMVGGHVVMWDVVNQWSCTCGYSPTSGYPQCTHVVRIARRLKPAEADRLVRARRAAGHSPSREAFDADRRVHPGEVVNRTTY